MKKNTLFNKVCKCCLLLGSILICFIVLEIVADKIFFVPKVEGLDFHSYGADYMLSDNRNLIYVPKPNIGEHNSHGHRGIEFTYEKGKEKRILFLGDSVVEGLGINVQDRFTEILHRLQNERYEIINLGVRGYNFKQMVEYLEEFGLKFNADYIFLGITYNDLILHSGEIRKLNSIFKQMKHSSFYTNYYRTKSSIGKLLLKTKIYRLIRYRNYSTEHHFKSRMSYRISPDEQKKILGDLIELSNNFNIKISFFFLPVNTDREKEELVKFRELIMSSGFDLYDLEAIASRIHKNRAGLFFRNDPCHLNILGNKIVAEMINRLMNKFIIEKQGLELSRRVGL